jgi:hypothetical protein
MYLIRKAKERIGYKKILQQLPTGGRELPSGRYGLPIQGFDTLGLLEDIMPLRYYRKCINMQYFEGD